MTDVHLSQHIPTVDLGFGGVSPAGPRFGEPVSSHATPRRSASAQRYVGRATTAKAFPCALSAPFLASLAKPSDIRREAEPPWRAASTFDLDPHDGDASPARGEAAQQGTLVVDVLSAWSQRSGRLRLVCKLQCPAGQRRIPSKRNLQSIHGCRHDLSKRGQRSHGSHSFSECFLAWVVFAQSGSTTESVGARFGAQPRGH